MLGIKKPFKGLLVLDCSTLIPGPSIGKTLADQGAKVIKIENPNHPDGALTLGKTFYKNLNIKKKIVKLDLKTDLGQKSLRAWVKRADLLIEGFRPKAKQQLRLDSKSIHKINSKTIVVSLSGFPKNHTFASRAVHDLNIQALTGLLSITHVMPPLPFADMFTVQNALSELSLALYLREKGQTKIGITVDMWSTMNKVQSLFSKEFIASQIPLSPGSQLFSGIYPCYQIYKASDGVGVSVAALEPKFWKLFLSAMNLTELLPLQLSFGDAAKVAKMAIALKFAEKPSSYWRDTLEPLDCCVFVLRNYAEV